MADTDLLTTDEVETALGITDTADLSILETYISAASEKIDALCGPVVVRNVIDEPRDSDGAVVSIRLNMAPVLEIIALWDGETLLQEDIPNELLGTYPADGYMLYSKSGVVVRRRNHADSTFGWGRQTIQVNYMAGRYETTADVDGRFKQAAMMIVDRLWKLYQAAGTATYGTDGWVPARAVPPMVEELLADELLPPAVA